jgi:acetyl-CoA carboxylase biotin carboxyl carrier protein
MELSLSELREILRVFVDSELQDLHLEVGDVRLQVSKNGAPPPPAPTAVRTPAAAPPPAAAAPAVPAADAPDSVDRTGLVEVRSPAVGVFYRRPAPDQPSYVEVGDQVTPSTPIATIEVMKMFTEIPAGCDGTVVEICVENWQLVEHGQVLVYVRPA